MSVPCGSKLPPHQFSAKLVQAFLRSVNNTILFYIHMYWNLIRLLSGRALLCRSALLRLALLRRIYLGSVFAHTRARQLVFFAGCARLFLSGRHGFLTGKGKLLRCRCNIRKTLRTVTVRRSDSQRIVEQLSLVQCGIYRLRVFSCRYKATHCSNQPAIVFFSRGDDDARSRFTNSIARCV